MAARLICLEGPPGAGKSSLADELAAQLAAHGRAVAWREEHELIATVFRPFHAALDAAASDLPAALLGCWRELAAQIAADDATWVLDGAWFFVTGKFLLAADLPHTRIAATYRELDALLAALDPLVVHLTGDVARIVGLAIEERGSDWAQTIALDVAEYPSQIARDRRDRAGMIRFFVDSDRLLADLLRHSPVAQLRIDTTARDWPAYRRGLLDRLGLHEQPIEQAAPALPIAQIVGFYQPPEFFPEPYRRPFEVAATRSGPVLHMPFIRGLRLRPIDTHSFEIVARKLRLEFVVDARGAVTGAVYPFLPDQRFVCVRLKAPPVR